MLQHSLICKGCWQQMHVPIPLRGPLSLPFRLFGIKPSRMNPNTCTVCELMFTKVMRSRKITIDATVLFADLRDYTTLSQSQSPEAISALLDAFYDEAADAIWEHDGLLNKTIGDAVMAVFNFPIRQEDHVGQAMKTARAIQARWTARARQLGEERGLDVVKSGIGIGIHCGDVSFGEFGRSHKDLTAIGNVVNTASRAQSAAKAGEILVTQAVHDRLSPQAGTFRADAYQLKGFVEPMTLYAPLGDAPVQALH
jgi:class 3 adenylate cyclase